MKIAFWLISFAQVVLLAVQHQAPPQVVLAAILCAIAVPLLWQIRSLLPAHADMLLIMTAFGGFGMLAGGYGQPTCHNSYTSQLGMLVASLPLSLKYARCLQVPERFWLLALDTVGMLAGMEISHRLASGAGPWAMHLAMLCGMNLGMGLRFALPVCRLPGARPTANVASPATTTSAPS